MHLKIAIFLALSCTLCSVDAAPAENRGLDNIIDTVYNQVQKILSRLEEIIANQNVDSLIDELKDVTVEGLAIARNSIDETIDNVDLLADVAKKVGKVTASCVANQGSNWKQLKESLLVIGITCVSEVNSEIGDLITNAEQVLQEIQPHVDNVVGKFVECSDLETIQDKIKCIRNNHPSIITSAVKVVSKALTLKDVAITAAKVSASCASSTGISLPSQLLNIAKDLRSCVHDQIKFPSLKKLSICKAVGGIKEKAVSVTGRIGYTVQSNFQSVLTVAQDVLNVLVARYQDKVLLVARTVVSTVDEVKKTFNEVVEPCIRKQESELIAFMEKVVASAKVCSVVASHAAFATGKTLVPYAGKVKGYAGEITNNLVQCQGNSEDIMKTVSCLDAAITDVQLHEDEIKGELTSAYSQLKQRADVAADEIVSCTKSTMSELQVDVNNMMLNFVNCVAA